MKTKKLIIIGMLSALALLTVALIRIPVVMFLSYEPKDVIITIGGFIMGPLTALIISLIVSLLEMVTISSTGIIGCVMNLLSSCAFACSAAYIYKKKHTLSGAVIGLLTGCIAMTAVMLLWNYLITPLYMGYPREAVAKMLIPTFLPFNLVKSGLNAGITLLVYKPVVGALRKANMLESSNATPSEHKVSLILVGLFIVLTCVFFVLVLRGIV